MKNSISLFTAVLLLLWIQPLLAQDRFALELRPGVSFATQDLGDADLNTGFGFEGIFDYRFSSHLGAYVGWGWNKFSADESFAGNEVDFEETGYLFGLQLNHSFEESALGFYARAGGIYNHIEMENQGGDIISDSGHGLGWQLGVGLDISLGSNWQLKPGVKYQALSRDIEMEERTTPLDLTYLCIGVGLAKRF